MEINGNRTGMPKFPLWMLEGNNNASSKESSDIEPRDQFSMTSSSEEYHQASGEKIEGHSVTASGEKNQVFDGISGFPIKKWTILMYSAADNDLEKFMVRDAIEVEKVGTPNGANIVMQLDRGTNPSEVSGQWQGARRIEIKQDDDAENLNSPVIEDLGQINMSDPKNLQNFIEWGIKNYPAENYMLIISDHGAGWRGSMQDMSHSGWMSMPSMREALEDARESTGVKIDIVGFDACLMGQTEVAYELKDQANYMVASQDLEGAEGWPYQHILSADVLKRVRMALLTKANLEPEILAKFLVHSAAKDPENLPTMSAIDLKKMNDVGKATNEFAKALVETYTPNRILTDVIRRSQAFEGFKDYFDFARNINNSDKIDDEKLKEAALKIMDTIHNAVLIEEHNPETHPGANGLTINLPSYRMTPPKEYLETEFAKDTNWDEALGRLDSMFMAQGLYQQQTSLPIEESDYTPWDIASKKEDLNINREK